MSVGTFQNKVNTPRWTFYKVECDVKMTTTNQNRFLRFLKNGTFLITALMEGISTGRVAHYIPFTKTSVLFFVELYYRSNIVGPLRARFKIILKYTGFLKKNT